MATAESVKAKIEGLLSEANSITGKEDKDLTTAVHNLMDGYGSGGESGGDYTNEQIAALMNGTATDFTFLDGVTEIRHYLFSDTQITNVVLPDTLNKIGNYAFSTCQLLQLSALPDSVEFIGNAAFNRCNKIKLSKLPNQLKTIGGVAFYACSGLTITEIPAGVETIGDTAFHNCSGITNLTFKGTPTSISSTALRTSSITTINVPWSEGEVANAPWGATNATINYNYTGG